MTLSDIRGGFQIAAEATTDEAVSRLGLLGVLGVRKFSLQIRRVGEKEIVSLVVELPTASPFNLFQFLPIDPNSQDSITTKKQIENMLGVPDGTCHMI